MATVQENKVGGAGSTTSVGGQPSAETEELDLLEEDDEFEEFQRDSWEGADEDREDTQLWEDNWDDDDVDDDFNKQLRAELEKTAGKAGASAAAPSSSSSKTEIDMKQ